MTLDQAIFFILGAVSTLTCLVVFKVVIDLFEWLMTPRVTPDEHHAITPHIELIDLEQASHG